MLQNELSITHRNFASFHCCPVKDKTVSFRSVDNDSCIDLGEYVCLESAGIPIDLLQLGSTVFL